MKNGSAKPPAGTERESFYDENGKFESYYSGKVPEEFISKKSMFTSPVKMSADIEYKMSKLVADQNAELAEFERTHDFKGDDQEEYNNLRRNQKRVREEAYLINDESLKKFRKEVYERTSPLE